MNRRRWLWRWGLVSLSLAMTGCDRPPSLNAAVVDEILVKAAQAAKPVLLKHSITYCTSPGIDPSNPNRFALVRGEHAIVLFDNKMMEAVFGTPPPGQVRVLKAPAASRLPPAALAALSGGLGEKCRYDLTFHQPLFVELKEQGEVKTLAVVDLDLRWRSSSSNRPSFGFGFGVTFRRTAGGWMIEPPGVESTWIS